MGWYANLKIGKKMLLGFSAVIIISTAMGLTSIWGMGKIDDMLVEINKTIMVQVVYSNDINANLTMHNRRALRHILATGQEDMQQIRSQMQLNELAIRDLLEKYRNTQMDSTEQRLLERFTRRWPDYVTITGQISRLSAEGKKQEALQLTEGSGREVFHELENALNDLIRYNISESRLHDEQGAELYHSLRFSLFSLMFFSIMLSAAIAWRITRSVVKPVQQALDTLRSLSEGAEDKAQLAGAIASGDLNRKVRITEPLQLDETQLTRDEAGILLKTVADISSTQATVDSALARMTEALRHARSDEESRTWLNNGISGINLVLMRGDLSLHDMVEQSLTFICEYLKAPVGAFYLWDECDGMLELATGHGLPNLDTRVRRFHLGEGIVGQAAQERKPIIITDVPAGYLTVSSSLGGAEPFVIVAMPLIYDSRLVGAIEIGTFKNFGSHEQELLEQLCEVLSAGVGVNLSRRLIDGLLEQTQSQAEELRVQQEELQQTNEELEERAQMLEQQREQVKAKNREVEEASQEIKRKADEVERVSKYKSEFLANMSHELRTPLNSLMILSSLLRDNREGNLTDKQIEYAGTINGAGKDLLNLINDILDLSKIESGKLEYHLEDVSPSEICDQIRALFETVATEKGLSFEVSSGEGLPAYLHTDAQRTFQIVKNLISNAIKFTRSGGITVSLLATPAGKGPLPVPAVAFAISDTGIGIPQDKQELIFQAFQQADGSTSRSFGGTGLGLSISRQLARGMGGEVTLTSTVGSGSCFTLHLPLTPGEQLVRIEAPASNLPVPPAVTVAPPVADNLPPPFIPDDRDTLQAGERCILIIEDDQDFAKVLAETVRKKGFKVLAAGNGEGGIILAERFIPSAIILDVMLPGLDGWGVMRRIKDNLKTRHIPVHFVTCLEDRNKAMSMGALGFYTKPVSAEGLEEICGAIEEAIDKSGRNLLIVEDDKTEASSLVALLSERGVSITVAGGGEEALELMSRIPFDCIVMDLGLSDISGFEVLEKINGLEPNRRIPVIVHSGRELTRAEELQLRHYAESVIIKGTKSPERLLNEVSIFLHLVEHSMEPEKQRMIRAAMDSEAMLAGKKVLLVDDDMRNIFSLSSVLSEKGIEVLEAENGREALACLEQHPDIDLVLMDMMMPVMDGLAATRAIRENLRLKDLPIIALTAKAMKGDREECIRAGASDYIAKPVDLDKLFSLLRVWLYGNG
jgi:CheY-like chemotaxis protein